ncbi:MAG: class I SAM-dependent methyltransferase [Patescibacteria group bacterium]|nr:class I SAM-dependent methyltransferase [Patescibacteria group bacterium]MDE2116773.1 class I SAM-dependent methyltransferase [Patescibacteria group bacterium]
MKNKSLLELLEKNRASLGLKNSMIFDHENRLFSEIGIPMENAVVLLPKSKALINMTLSLVSDITVALGKIVLVGANDAGIRSAKEAFERLIGPVEKKIVGNHAALYVGRNAAPGAGSRTRSWRDFLSFARIEQDSIAIEAAVLPGIFSAGELDPGTKLLLEHIPYDRAAVLDVGCGAGAIGALYKKKNPGAAVTMTDSSLLAVNASEETLKKNSLMGDVILSDVFENIRGHFDLIVTNPPFHKGVGTDYSFIEKFARGAKVHLNKGGEVYVVANAFLPYQETLERHIGPTDIVADDGKFRVYRSRYSRGLSFSFD